MNVCIECAEVCRQKDYPDEESGEDRYKDVPGFIEVLRELPDKESLDSTTEEDQEVEAKRDEEGPLVLVTGEVNSLLCDDGHLQADTRWRHYHHCQQDNHLNHILNNIIRFILT